MKNMRKKKGIDPDWMFRPILNMDTSTNYDGGKIEQEWLDDMGN